MRIWRTSTVLFVLCAMLIQGCSGAKTLSVTPTLEPSPTIENTSSPSPVPENTPTPVPTITSEPVSLEGFSGKWISYNIIPLEAGQESKEKPGLRLTISENQYMVDGSVCEAPVYQVKNISLEDFFQGKTPPASSIELNEKEFPYLTTRCANLKPASLANINSRTLAAVIGNDLLYFEPDFSITADNMSIESDLLAESNKNPLYEIHAQIPLLIKPDNAKFNKLAETIITTETNGFRTNFDDWNIPAEMAGYTSFMWIRYDVPLLTPDLVSIRFAVDYYMAGAAHPNHFFKVLNYDLKEDREISFDKLFNNSTVTLNFLSKASKASLDKPDFPMFEEGFAPKKENFTNWNLTKDGFRISFDPIQVAPYAAGPQEVLIPYKELQGQINLKTSAGAFIAR